MLKYVGYDIVFQEIPDEVTLAVNLSLCPNHCEGCHSPYLADDCGNILDEKAIDGMIAPWSGEVTCFCFMGGDNDPSEVIRLAEYIKRHYVGNMKTAWYSGKADFPDVFFPKAFDYVKIGPYIPAYGPLNKRSTNQRLYRIHDNGMREDITERFWKKTEHNTYQEIPN